MDKQKTLKKIGSISGIALHTGARAILTMNPAEINSGIIFSRVDLPNKPTVRALASKVVDARRGTTIAENDAIVYTVEHIMSALHAMQIDNCLVEMNGPEPPILDGSSDGYIKLIQDAGIVEQDAEAKYFEFEDIIHTQENDTQIVATPYDGFRIACTASFAGCPLDPQYYSLEIDSEKYIKDISLARTFVNFADLKQLIAMGLVKGGSLDAAAIINDGAIICKEELRYENEIVRHKILDLIGDLFLCGRRVKGNFIAVKPGHARNVALALEMEKSLNKN